MREVLGGRKENILSPTRGHFLLALSQIRT